MPVSTKFILKCLVYEFVHPRGQIGRTSIVKNAQTIQEWIASLSSLCRQDQGFDLVLDGPTRELSEGDALLTGALQSPSFQAWGHDDRGPVRHNYVYIIA